MQIAVLPEAEWLDDAVRAGGGTVGELDGADGLVWSDAGDPDGLADALAQRPDLPWVQLPFAGIETFVHLVDGDRTWTCAKGVYADPCAEMALALTLACCRGLPGYARADGWGEPRGRNLLGARVTVLGAGGIAQAYLRLLAPFGCTTTVLTANPRPVDGADEVVSSDELLERCPDTDVLVLALALTPETEGIVGAEVIAALPDHAVLVNVARGDHVDTDALVAALADGTLGGAGLDVTAPEPLPEGHPLWDAPGVVITPHTANTPEMGRPLLAERVEENVRRRSADEELLGLVDPARGY